ncbi:DNA-binding response OmpR family regulator [Pedobacter sp. UYP24]
MKVLIVEDEAELANSIVSYLSGQSYLCELAENYSKALKKYLLTITIAFYWISCFLGLAV